MAAKFTRATYEKIAECIREAREHAERIDHPVPTDVLYGIGYVEAEITRMFSEDNPNFDGEKFAKASGMRGL